MDVNSNGPVPAPQPPAPAPKWPTRLVGYVKAVAVLVAGLGATGVLQALHSFGWNDLPGWANAAITTGVALLGVLVSPKNQEK